MCCAFLGGDVARRQLRENALSHDDDADIRAACGATHGTSRPDITPEEDYADPFLPRSSERFGDRRPKSEILRLLIRQASTFDHNVYGHPDAPAPERSVLIHEGNYSSVFEKRAAMSFLEVLANR